MVISSACRAQFQTPSLSSLTAPVRPLILPWLAPAQLNRPSRLRTLHSPQSSPRWTDTSRTQPVRIASRQQGSLHGVDVSSADDVFSVHGGLPPPGVDAASDRKKGWNFDRLAGGGGSGDVSTDTRPRYVMFNTGEKESALYRLEATSITDSDDLLRHLHTSLRVGKLDRAQSILHRLTNSVHRTPETVAAAYTLFLDHFLTAVHRTPAHSEAAQQTYREMQAWYEHEFKQRHAQPTGPMMVAMIRGAIHALGAGNGKDTVRTLVEASSSSSKTMFEEVLFSDQYTDAEYDLVNKIVSYARAGSDTMPDPAVVGDKDPTAMGMPVITRRRSRVDLSKLAAILATPTQGRGLPSVQESMSALHELPALPDDVSSQDQLERNVSRQKLLEETAVEIAIRRWKEEDEQLKKIGINTVMQSKPMGALMYQWYTALLPELERELNACRELPHTLETTDELTTDRQHYGMYLELVPLSRIAANTILYTCSKMTIPTHAQETVETKLTSLCEGLGKQLEVEATVLTSSQRQASGPPGQRSTRRRLRRPSSTKLQQMASRVSAKEAQSTSHHDVAAAAAAAAARHTPLDRWPKLVKFKLGAMLIQKLISAAMLPVTRRHPRTKERITQLQPAFYTRTKYEKGRKQGILCANPAYLSKLQSEPVPSLLAKRMPMIVEPRPWRSFIDGGYLSYPTDIMRTLNQHDGCKAHFVAASNRGDLEQLYAGLNNLGKVPWRVNRDVFSTQLEAWNSGLPVANLAPLHFQHKLPPAPDASAGLDARRRWLSEIRTIENKRSGNFSVRCFQNFQLEVARAMLNETMYFPHNIDFRGRAYPIPPYLNHIGADNVRGLLEFGEGKELGEAGLRWLKIHLANVAGYDKASLQERENFTMAHLNQIRDSARDPMGGGKWWLKAEDAWQTLAACFELTNALACPDPTKFVSHLPVHQDGTCNGLQHYAALGGDKSGAMHVNLEPGDRPADIYSGVAAGVAQAVEQDAAAGHPVAKVLVGHISRKVVKHPVMTNVYGVTKFGARAQVRKQIEDLLPDVGKFADINHGKMSGYIVAKIFNMLGTMFTGAQAIQRWLEVCADKITTCLLPEQIDRLISEYEKKCPEKSKAKKSGRSGTTAPRQMTKQATSSVGEKRLESNPKDRAEPLFKATVVWTTPLQLPVVQPYRTSSARTIRTALQQLTIHEPRLWDPVNRRKQLQAFPPNFIHSLDATHMLMSANKCAEVGITFASVHDSFWTHAGDVSKMSEVLRDAFVAMHSEDIIGRLREEFSTRYRGCLCLTQVDSSSAVFKKIKLWRKHNSHVKQELYELKLEAERMRLLSSTDAAARILGAQMITPGSILEADEATAAAAPPTKSSQAIASLEQHDQRSHPERDTELADNDDLDTEAGHSQRSTPAPKAKQNKIKVWQPVRFPPVPQKGDFDVTRLRQSKYFFH